MCFPFLFQVDFANRESQLAFYHSMEKTGQDIRDFYEMLAERRHVSILFTNYFIYELHSIFLFSSVTFHSPFTIIVLFIIKSNFLQAIMLKQVFLSSQLYPNC